jgi:hypothetical protein
VIVQRQVGGMRDIVIFNSLFEKEEDRKKEGDRVVEERGKGK